MGNRHPLAFGILAGVALAGVALAGCTPSPAIVTLADAVNAVRTGQPLLSCREACLAEWRSVQPQAAQFEAARRWADLALLVLRVNYQDDLTLFYLGRAAEALGYVGAAAAYYRQSAQLSGTTISCQNLSRMCGGVALPRAALQRVAAIDQELAHSRRIGTTPARAAAPPPAEIRQSSEPPPLSAGDSGRAPSETRAPPPPPASPAPSEFIEPPPAAR